MRIQNSSMLIVGMIMATFSFVKAHNETQDNVRMPAAFQFVKAGNTSSFNANTAADPALYAVKPEVTETAVNSVQPAKVSPEVQQANYRFTSVEAVFNVALTNDDNLCFLQDTAHINAENAKKNNSFNSVELSGARMEASSRDLDRSANLVNSIAQIRTLQNIGLTPRQKCKSETMVKYLEALFNESAQRQNPYNYALTNSQPACNVSGQNLATVQASQAEITRKSNYDVQMAACAAMGSTSAPTTDTNSYIEPAAPATNSLNSDWTSTAQ